MKLIIASPTFGTPDSATVSYAYHQSVLRFARDPQCDIPYDWMTYSCDLTRARSRASRLAMADPEMTNLLFWDTDVGIKDPTIVPYMLSLDLDVVCFPYARKKLHWENVALAVRDEREQAEHGRQSARDLESAACSWTTRTYGDIEGEHRNLIRVRECGMGFTMISRRCLEKMTTAYAKDLTFRDGADGSGAPTVALFHLLFRDGEMAPEDYSFCYRWQDLGGEVWMVLPRAGDGPAVHVGSYVYGGGLVVE